MSYFQHTLNKAKGMKTGVDGAEVEEGAVNQVITPRGCEAGCGCHPHAPRFPDPPSRDSQETRARAAPGPNATARLFSGLPTRAADPDW